MKKFIWALSISAVLAGVVYLRITGAFDEVEHTNRPSVKRVIGMPGDRIEVREKTVYINGARLNN